MSTNTTISQADSVVRKAYGSVAAGTTADSYINIPVGFVPKRVKVQGIVNLLSYEWQDGMNQGDYFKTLANGTRSLETDDKLLVGASNDQGTTAAALAPEGTFNVLKVAGGVLDDGDGFIWEAEG